MIPSGAKGRDRREAEGNGGNRSDVVKNRTTRLASDYKSSLRPPRSGSLTPKPNPNKKSVLKPIPNGAKWSEAVNNRSNYKTNIRLRGRPQTTKARTPTPRLNPNKKSVLKFHSKQREKRIEAVKNLTARLAPNYKSSFRPPRPEPQSQDSRPTTSLFQNNSNKRSEAVMNRTTRLASDSKPQTTKARSPTPRLTPKK